MAKEKNKRGQGEWSFSQRNTDGLWTARKMFGRKADGKPNIVAFYGRTRTEVKEKAAAYEATLAASRVAAVSKETIADYFEDWMKSRKTISVKRTTYDTYEDTLTSRIKPFGIASVQMCNLSVELMQDYMNQLTKCDKNYSLGTITKTYNQLNACFKDAEAAGDIAKNPMPYVKKPTEDSLVTKTTEMMFFTEDQALRLCEQAEMKFSNGVPKYYYGLTFEILLKTGLRVGELLDLKWGNVDLNEGTLKVVSTRAYVKTRDEDTENKRVSISTSPKSKKSKRSIKLSKTAVEAFKNLRKQNLSYGLPVGPDDLVVMTKKGQPGDDSNLNRSLEAIVTALGIPDASKYTVHSLRHTFATILLKKGVPVNVVSAILGHEKPSTTYDIYAHVINEQLDDIADIIDHLGEGE